MRYFADFRDALESGEIERADSDAKPRDTGGDCLPFDHLEDRRFEVLAYRLRCATLDDRANRVRLMQGTGERGRDILVYTVAGRLAAIIQCKKYRDRMDGPVVVRELLKLAFHAVIDPTVLGSDAVSYELWCPGGLTEPAAKLLDSWPLDWTEARLAPEAAKVLQKYAAFDELTWDSAKTFVTTTFPQLVRPRDVDGLAISALVRNNRDIYGAFFQGMLVMEKEHVERSVEDVIRRVMGEQSRVLTDGDARHVLDRISSFGVDERIVSNCALVMGLKPELVSRFRRGEYETFATHLVQGLFGLIQVVMNACSRIQGDIVRGFRERVQPKTRSLPDVVGQILAFSMLARLTAVTMPSPIPQPSMAAYEALSLDGRFDCEVERLWRSFQTCLSAYDPSKHAPGSDEEFRARIATFALEGIDSRIQFGDQLRASFETHRAEIERIFVEWMALIPKQILLVADTMSIFESEWLMKRYSEGIERMTMLRGSAIIPE